MENHKPMAMRTWNNSMSGMLFVLVAAILTGCASRPKNLAVDWPKAIGAGAAGEATGPTLLLNFDRKSAQGSPVNDFMYFVALISPEPVTVSQSPGNTQRAWVTNAVRKVTASAFEVKCDFEITGAGRQQNIFDHSANIQRHEKRLKTGAALERLLGSITLEGPGCGSIEVEGTVSNRAPVVTEIRLRFNAHGRPSPVLVGIHDIQHHQGAFVPRNELVGRVNTLTFRREPGPPSMHVTLASLNRKDAGHGAWQNLVGGLKGIAVNLFIPPLAVEAAGHRAMLDFGLAIAAEAPEYTFPRARNLKPSP